MTRNGTVVWLALAGLSALALFPITYKVKALEDELAQINRAHAHSQESIRVLRAEWAYLTRPERLADLAGRHLDLVPMTGAQIASFDAVPQPVDLAAARDAAASAGTLAVEP